mgnify:CR=1 FL=1
MADEPQIQPQEENQEPFQDNTLTLKDEIKNELKDEFRKFHQKRKRRVIYSVCIFALGVLIGFGGGRSINFDHHIEHGQYQKWHHFRE